jgi:hypothetical protein
MRSFSFMVVVLVYMKPRQCQRIFLEIPVNSVESLINEFIL